MTPVDHYRLALQHEELQPDPAQAAFVGRLQGLHQRLVQRAREPAPGPGQAQGFSLGLQ